MKNEPPFVRSRNANLLRTSAKVEQLSLLVVDQRQTGKCGDENLKPSPLSFRNELSLKARKIRIFTLKREKRTLRAVRTKEM